MPMSLVACTGAPKLSCAEGGFMQKLNYSSPDRLIGSCSSWADFRVAAASLSKKQKGDVFERLTQLYLQTAPEYQSQLKHVWLRRDVPPSICRRLNLPPDDEGIDLIACTRHGEYWAIQSKFRERDE